MPNSKSDQKKIDICCTWNALHPVGSPVFYWPALKKGEGLKSTTRSMADVRGGTPVVWVNFHSACIALTHIEPRGWTEKETFTPDERQKLWALVRRYPKSFTYGEKDLLRYEATVQDLEMRVKQLEGIVLRELTQEAQDMGMYDEAKK